MECACFGVLPPEAPGEGELTFVTDPGDCVPARVAECEAVAGIDPGVQALKDDFTRLSEAPVNGYDAPFWYRGYYFQPI